MNDSMNMNRKQKISYNEDSLDKIELDTQNKQGVFSDSSASSEKKAKSERCTEYLLESIVSKRKFLGYSFYYGRNGINFRVHEKSYERLKGKIRKITNRNVSMNFEYRIKKLNEILVGWVNYYKLADMKNRLKELDEWIRRRLRACIWKTWKKIRTRFKNLKKLGLSKDKAWEYANTRKGYWRISNSPILKVTITNEKLTRRGYKSLSSQYMKVRLS